LEQHDFIALKMILGDYGIIKEDFMKKITRCVKTMMFMLLCMMLFMTAEVKADEVILQKVNDLKQTNSSKDSFDVEWKSVACEGEIVEYEVYISKNKEEWNRYESYSNN